jgi:hypothetical protein
VTDLAGKAALPVKERVSEYVSGTTFGAGNEPETADTAKGVLYTTAPIPNPIGQYIYWHVPY